MRAAKAVAYAAKSSSAWAKTPYCDGQKCAYNVHIRQQYSNIYACKIKPAWMLLAPKDLQPNVQPSALIKLTSYTYTQHCNIASHARHHFLEASSCHRFLLLIKALKLSKVFTNAKMLSVLVTVQHG